VAILSDQYGPLKGWQWLALAGGAGALYYLYQARKNAAATSATDTAAQGGAVVGGLPGATQLEPIVIQSGTPSTPAPATVAGFGVLGNFITTTIYKDLSAAQKALLQPITTANGAHGYIPKSAPIPQGAHAGFVTLKNPNTNKGGIAA
jgi:hypothetical protein